MAVKKDIDTFERLYKEYKDDIWYLIRSRIDKACDADDLVQDVFVKLWEFRSNIDEDRSPKSLLYKMAVNTAFNYKKHKNIIRKHETYLSCNHIVTIDSPHSSFIFSEINSKIETILKNCPNKQREIFEMYWKNGWSRSEIARDKNISIKTADNQIYRVMRVLRKELRY